MTWWAIQTVAITAVMAAMISAVSRWRRIPPATVHLLWLLVVVRFMVPPVIEWPWPLTSLIGADEPVLEIIDRAPITLRLIGDLADTTPELPFADRASTNTAPAPYWQAAVARINPAPALLGLWLVTVVVVAGIQALRLSRIRRLLRETVAAPDWMREEVERLAARIKTTSPDVEVTERLAVPVYWNLGRARLLVPQTLLDTLGREAWTSIVLHELAHHKRRDHWVGWLEFAAGCVWWWNPIFWYARRRLRENAELACDAWVVAVFPDKRRDYANALLHVFESVSQRAQRRLAWSMAADIRLGFERRLRMIYTDRIGRRSHPAWIALALLLAVLVAPVWSLDEPAAPPAPAPDAAHPQSPAPKAESEPPPAQPPEASEISPTTEVTQVLDELSVSIEFEDEHIARVASFIAEYTDVNVVLDYRVIRPATADLNTVPHPEYVTDGHVRYISLDNIRLGDAIHALCLPLNLEYQAAPGFIWLSSPENIAAETWPPPPEGNDSEVEKALHEAYVSIEFEKEHINRIASFISEYVGVNIVLDSRVIAPVPPDIAENGVAAETVPAESADHVTTGMVPFINLHNVSLHQALLAILRPLDLGYRVEPGFIWISSPEILEHGIAPVRVPVKEEKTAAEPPAKLLRILLWTDGAYRAVFDDSGMRNAYREGDTFGRLQVVQIDVPEQKVTLKDVNSGEMLYLQPQQTADATTPVAASPDILRILPWSDGTYRVEVQIGTRKRYFREGDAFETYEIRTIDPESGSVTIWNEKLNANVIEKVKE